MAYNIIDKKGRLKFQDSVYFISSPFNGVVFGLIKKPNGVNLIEIPVKDMVSEDCINPNLYAKELENVTYITFDSSDYSETYLMFSKRKGKTCNYTYIKGRIGVDKKIGNITPANSYWYDILAFGNTEIGEGSATFTNRSFDFCSYNDEPDEIRGHYIKMRAGQSGDERKVYNYFDLQKGKFVLPDRFVYSIKYDNGKFIVNTSKNSFPEYYDLDGNKLKLDDIKDKIIIEASDRYRRVKIGKTKPIDAFIVKHRFYDRIYELFKDYNYDKDEFVNPICQFSNSLHVIDLDTQSKNGKSFYINNYERGVLPYNDSYGNPSSVFSSRLVDKVIENNEGDILLYTTPSNEIKYVDLNDFEEHTIYKGDDDEKLKIHAYSIYDYKRKNIIIQIGYKQYGNDTKYVDMNGNIKTEFIRPTDSVCYVDDWRYNGFFRGYVYDENKKEKTIFLKYNESNGDIEEVDMGGVNICNVDTHDGILYVQDKDTDYMHKYDKNLKCIDDDNIIMQKFYNPKSHSDYGYVVYHKDTKLYYVMPDEYDKHSQNISTFSQYPLDFFSMELNGEPYKPKSITIVGSRGNGDYAARSMIALIAERYVGGALKKTLFISDGQFPKDEKDLTKGRKWFTVGEYDDITVTDYWHTEEGYFGMTSVKKDMENNRIYVTDGGKETTYGVTYTADGHMRLIKKRS